MRALLACIVLALSACATVAPAPKSVLPDPAVTPLSAIGLYRCGKVAGAVVITKDGKIHMVFGLTLSELKAIGDSVPVENIASLNSVEDCAPHQAT